MGLLRLLALPVTGPLWVVKQVIREAEREYYDPQAILAQLSELARRREMNEIDAAEFGEQEALLLERLSVAATRSTYDWNR
jgi:hypothetical protein